MKRMMAWLCRVVFGVMGWKLSGKYPSEMKKMLIIAAPHTSSMDLFIGLLVNFGIGIRGKFYGKQELFKGVQGRVLRYWGGVPIDRSGGKNMVQAIVNDIKQAERRIVVIAPEGTRECVEHFKTGFYHIARGAGIPILPAVFDYQNKTIHLLELIYTQGDPDREIPQIEAMFRGVQGHKREKSFY